MKRSLIYTCLAGVILLLLSVIIALNMGGIHSLEDLRQLSEKQKSGVIELSDLIAQGYEKNKDVYTSLNNDAGFIKTDVNAYVYDLHIEFEEPLKDNIEIQVYYTNSNGGFEANTPVSAQIEKDQTSAVLFPENYVFDIRIDITTQAGQNFSLKEISYNINASGKFSIGNFVTRTIILWLLLMFLTAHILYKPGKLYYWIEKNRYYIGLSFIVFCVIFEIHGSSIGEWAKYMPLDSDVLSDTLFGIPREVRSDEWATFTPMTFSQTFGEHSFSWFGNILRGTYTDMFMVYAQPVMTPLIIFRPFLIGFLFLGISRGLAFFWSARLVVLLLVSYEFFKMLTGNKKYAAAGGFLIALAPLVQWWFAINGLVEMLVFAQLSLLMLQWYMKISDFRKRCIALAVIIFCAGGFILTLYPAWQVPLFYMILAVALGIIIENRKVCVIRRRDIAAIGTAILCLSVCVGIVLFISWETIDLVMNTAYPGNRVGTGGGCTWTDLFKAWGNILFPIKSEGMPINSCESATFFDFFPLGIFFAIYVFIRKKKWDPMLICLLIIEIILGLYSIVGFPELLTKITGLSFSMGRRAMSVFSLVNLLVVFRSLKFYNGRFSWKWIGGSIIYACVVILASEFYYGDYLSTRTLIFVGVVSGVFVFFLLSNVKTFFCIGAIVLSLFAGALVNPVQRGIDMIYEFPLAGELRLLEEKDDEKWAAVNCLFPRPNYLLMYGLPTVNSTNIYPSFETWGKLDPKGIYKDIYNRYAHVTMYLTNDTYKEKFELINKDWFQVNVTIDDLKTLDIHYVFSGENLRQYILSDEVTLIASGGGYYIYEILESN